MDLRKIKAQQDKKSKRRGVFRNSLIVILTLVITTLAVNATDRVSEIRDNLIGGAAQSVGIVDNNPCESDMVLVSSPKGDFCIDRYEASAGPNCPYRNPQSVNETQQNLNDPNCTIETVTNAAPWTHISHQQAISACSKDGKHLTSNSEWFFGSLGTPDREFGWGGEDCNVSNNWGGGKGRTGNGASCVSDSGAYDMIGNVWEWNHETVVRGVYNGFELPESGFVSSVTEEGIPTETSDESSSLFFHDRFWVDKEKHTGIIRGGFWNNQTDAGRFAVLSEIPPTFTGDAVGFRCAK